MNCLQKTQLNILLLVDKLCRENHIVYYLIGGTALGAMRHHGFIPWDDDIDIIMTIEDYAHFKDAFIKSDINRLVLQENYISSNYWCNSKIRLDGTTQIEREEDKSSTKSQGIFIDVFPLRKVSATPLLQKRQFFLSQYLTMRKLMEQGWTAKSKKQRMLIKLSRFIPNKLLFRIAVSCIEHSEQLSDGYEYCFFEIGRNIPMKRLIFPVSMFDKPALLPFEGVNLPVPTDCHRYLTQMYGDYMTLPPVKDRTQFAHGILVDPEQDYHVYLNPIRTTKIADTKWVEYYPLRRKI